MDKELDYVALGQRIRKTRENRQFTQEQLGEACLLSASHIGHIERGTRIPSIETLYKIACTLDVSIDFLIFDSLPANIELFPNIVAILRDKDKNKVKSFMNTVKILVDKIDEL